MKINKYLLYFGSFFAMTASVAYAAGFADVKYPIAELGGCKDQAACQIYCENTDNMSACISFGEKNGLISGEEARVGKLAVDKIQAGNTPGKCKSKAECESYCSGNVDAVNECIAFGEELGSIPAEELVQAKKVAAALQAGAKMPGGCSNKGTCESYCKLGEHIDECLNFAEVAGLLPAGQLAEAKKMAQFVKSGETPGKCTDKDSCDAYCAEDANFGECIGFAEKAGLVSAEDAAIAKKTGGKGPGNCKSKDSCETYCNSPEHADECVQFAMDKGLISAEDQQKMKEGPEKIRQGLEQVPAEARAEIETCLKNAVGSPEAYDKMMSGGGASSLTKDSGAKIEKCFNDIMANYAKTMMEKSAGGKGLPAGINPEDFKNGAPSAEEVQQIKEKMIKEVPGGIPEGVDVEQFKNGAPSPEEMQKIREQMIQKVAPQGIPEGVDTEQFKSGPPSAEQIDQIKAQIMQQIPQGIPVGVPQVPPSIPQGSNGMGL